MNAELAPTTSPRRHSTTYRDEGVKEHTGARAAGAPEEILADSPDKGLIDLRSHKRLTPF